MEDAQRRLDADPQAITRVMNIMGAGALIAAIQA